jgi:hypothetical protein
MISRRIFIKAALSLIGQQIFFRPRISWAAPFPHFFFAQINYRGGEWDPNPFFPEAIIEELELRTSINAFKERRVITPLSPELFFCPFLYMAGRYEFDPFTAQEREILRRFLTYGGFLLAEDTVGAKGFGFDHAFRRELSEIFPDEKLKQLPPDHSVYQSFYLIQTHGGRQNISPYLEGISIGRWTPVIYCQNDLAGAWSRDRYGNWVHECVPGGESQRKAAFKMGINIIVYALTADYKKDLVHHPFIKGRKN